MEDISKTTIGVLLILVVIISVIGTWVVLNSITVTQQPASQSSQTQSQGNLRLTVLPQSQPAKSSSSSGTVTLNVLKSGEKGGE